MRESRFYMGIGSRGTPSGILLDMERISFILSENDFTLWSGGAFGADLAFEKNAKKKRIFYAQDATPKAIELSSKYHPNWNACGEYARKLHGRNSMIALGEELLTPADFCVCWTIDGKDTGGTGQAMRIALDYGIPIFNLYFPDTQEKLLAFLLENYGLIKGVEKFVKNIDTSGVF